MSRWAPALLAALLLPLGAPPAAEFDEADLDGRILKLRCGDFTVSLKGRDGKPVRGEARYALVRHAFPFGVALNHAFILSETPDARRYQETVERHFNAAVHENALKWHFMEPASGVHRDEEALKVWDWCHARGIPMRGHCVFWGVREWVQPWVQALDGDALEKAMKARAARVLGLFRGKISDYDVNNEMAQGDCYRRVLGWKHGAGYFRWCREAAPETRLFVNEFNLADPKVLDRYEAGIRELLDAGAEIGGVGDQGHFFGGVPSNPELWRAWDRLAAFGRPLWITELDVVVQDEARQAAGLRRVLKAAFAHPAVQGIVQWGFWEGSHWKPDGALWRKDWTIKPSGQAYLDLVEGEWRTRGEGRLDEEGVLRFRGFHGDYRIEAGGRTWRVSLGAAAPAARAEERGAGP